MENSREHLEQVLSFLNEVEHNHIYKTESFSKRYTYWPVIQKDLTEMEAMNEKDGYFGMDIGTPLPYLRQMYSQKLAALEQVERTRREERRHRLWQDVWIALSVIVSAIALTLTLTD